MERVIVVLVLVAVAGLFALVLRRVSAPAEPAAPKSWTVPAQLHRGDFAHPDKAVLVVVFSSATCDNCVLVWDRVKAMATADVAVVNVAWQDQRAVHERYGIDAAPTTVVADREGVVRTSYVGAVSTLELRAALREVLADQQ